jgi:hypothetical protein
MPPTEEAAKAFNRQLRQTAAVLAGMPEAATRAATRTIAPAPQGSFRC